MSDSLSKLEVWCFGCIGNPGHFLWLPRTRLHIDLKRQPWGDSIDGLLCQPPSFQRADTKPWTHHKDGWTAVAFWDQSGDRRPGSCTVFLVKAEATTEEVLTAAKQQWRDVWNRRGFPLQSL